MYDTISDGVFLAAKFLRIKETLKIDFADADEFPTRDTASVFLKDSLSIVFNRGWLDKAEFIEIIVTCYHEMRHVYQWLQVTGQMEIKEDTETLKKWKAEFNNYLPPNDKGFLFQDIEIDAIAFAHFLADLILDVKTVIPRVIRGKVLKRVKQIASEY